MTQTLKRQPAQIHPYLAPSGYTYLLPCSNAHLIRDEVISENILSACFPRVNFGDAVNGISHSPVTGYCEVREGGVIVFKHETVWGCERAGYRFERVVPVPDAPIVRAIEAIEADQPEGAWEPLPTDADAPDDDLHVAPKQTQPRARTRQARNDMERARFAFWAAANSEGVVVRGKMETPAQRDARLRCVADYLGLPSVASLSELDAGQIDRVTAAIRRGDVGSGWTVLEMAA